MRLLAAAALVLALATPVIAGHASKVDPGVTMTGMRALKCEETTVLKQDYEGGALGYWVVLKLPNKDPKIVIYFPEGVDSIAGDGVEIYMDGKPATLEQLGPDPCAFFGSKS